MLARGSVSCHRLPSANNGSTHILRLRYAFLYTSVVWYALTRSSTSSSTKNHPQKKRGAGVFLRECPILFSNEGAVRWRHFLQAFPVQRKRDLEGRWAKIGNSTHTYPRRASLSPLAVGRGSDKRSRIQAFASRPQVFLSRSGGESTPHPRRCLSSRLFSWS